MKVLNRPMFRYGGPIKEGVMSGIKERVPYKTGGNYFSNLGGAIANFYNPIKKARPIQKIIKKLKVDIPPSRVPNTSGMGGVTLTPAQIKAGMGTKGVPFLTRAKQFAQRNPIYTGIGAPLVASGAITATPPVAKGLYGLGKSGVMQLADLAVPDFIFDQDQYFKDKEK